MSKAPREIIELSFADPATAADQVERLLPTIDHYRSQGQSLRKIYDALIAGEHLSNCKWRTFETLYYRTRESS